jgi:hypothetical protein
MVAISVGIHICEVYSHYCENNTSNLWHTDIQAGYICSRLCGGNQSVYLETKNLVICAYNCVDMGCYLVVFF